MNEQLSLIQRFRKTVIGEYAEALIWAVALALVLTTFVVQAFKIPSGSMLETLQIDLGMSPSGESWKVTSIANMDKLVSRLQKEAAE